MDLIDHTYVLNEDRFDQALQALTQNNALWWDQLVADSAQNKNATIRAQPFKVLQIGSPAVRSSGTIHHHTYDLLNRAATSFTQVDQLSQDVLPQDILPEAAGAEAVPVTVRTFAVKVRNWGATPQPVKDALAAVLSQQDPLNPKLSRQAMLNQLTSLHEANVQQQVPFALKQAKTVTLAPVAAVVTATSDSSPQDQPAASVPVPPAVVTLPPLVFTHKTEKPAMSDEFWWVTFNSKTKGQTFEPDQKTPAVMTGLPLSRVPLRFYGDGPNDLEKFYICALQEQLTDPRPGKDYFDYYTLAAKYKSVAFDPQELVERDYAKAVHGTGKRHWSQKQYQIVSTFTQNEGEIVQAMLDMNACGPDLFKTKPRSFSAAEIDQHPFPVHHPVSQTDIYVSRLGGINHEAIVFSAALVLEQHGPYTYPDMSRLVVGQHNHANDLAMSRLKRKGFLSVNKNGASSCVNVVAMPHNMTADLYRQGLGYMQGADHIIGETAIKARIKGLKR